MSEGILEIGEGIRRSQRRGYDYEMEGLSLMAESVYTAWAVSFGLSVFWHHHVEKVVPRPYLVRPSSPRGTSPLANVEDRTSSSTCNKPNCISKAASPNGIQKSLPLQDCRYNHQAVPGSADISRYLLSLTYLGALSLVGILELVDVADLRRTNAWAAGLFPYFVHAIVERTACIYDGFRHPDIHRMLWSLAELNHATMNICLFPPLFFFYGLYYTDVWSALSVVITIHLHQRKRMRAMVIAAIASLFLRQTNIFWVGIYLTAWEVARKIRRGRIGMEYVPTATWRAVLVGSWQHSCFYDPLVAQASFEGT